MGANELRIVLWVQCEKGMEQAVKEQAAMALEALAGVAKVRVQDVRTVQESMRGW